MLVVDVLTHTRIKDKHIESSNVVVLLLEPSSIPRHSVPAPASTTAAHSQEASRSWLVCAYHQVEQAAHAAYLEVEMGKHRKGHETHARHRLDDGYLQDVDHPTQTWSGMCAPVLVRMR